jgi:hypothetical protein
VLNNPVLRGICHKTRNKLPISRVYALLLGVCLVLDFAPSAVAAISPVGASASGDGVSLAVSSLSLSNPGSLSGDVLLAQVVVGAGNVTITPPSGWTSYKLDVKNALTQELFYRVAGAVEPASYSFSFGALSARASGGLLVGRGIALSGGSPIAQKLSNSGTGDTLTALSASVSTSNSRVLRYFAFDHGNEALNGPATQHYAPATGAGPNGVAASTSSIAQAASGVTGSATATAGGTSADWLGVTVVLAPAAPPVLSWSFDESVWTGLAGEVLETSGNNLNGTTFNGPNTDGVSPALVTDSSGRGTCRYGVFNTSSSSKKYVQVADNNLLDLSSFTVSAWVYNTARPSSGLMTILSKDTNYEFHIKPSGVINWWWTDSGGTAREFDSVAKVPLDAWTHVAIRFVAGDQRIYINGVRDTSNASFSKIPQTNSAPLQIGNDLGVAGRYWRGNIDEVRVNNSALTDAEILAQVSERHPCVAAVPDHLELLHDGTALTCQPETVTLRACANASCSLLFSGIVTATLSPSGWVGGNTVTFSGGSVARKLRVTSPAIVTLGVGAVTPAPPNLSQCFNGSTASCSLDFKDAGFIFDVPSLLANKPSAAVSVTAVRKDENSQLCVPAFDTVTRTLKFWSSYSNPLGGTRSVGVNNTPVIGASPGTSISLAFDANAQASIAVHYPDAGQMSLNASYSGSVLNGDAGLLMTGSDAFVVRPAGLCVDSDTANSDCASGDASCSKFVAAGSPFRQRIKAVAWESDSDSDMCTGNGDTPNYQQAAIALSSTLVAPSPGNAASLGLTSSDLLAVDSGEKLLSAQTVSEVGVFRLTATPPALGYFGDTVAAGTSVNIGRFYPASFLLSDPLLTPACPGGFSYAGLSAQAGPPVQAIKVGQPFGFSGALSARNLSGGLTGNYTGTFAKLTAAGLGYTDSVVPAAGTVSVSNSQLSVPGIGGNGYLDYNTKTAAGIDSAIFLLTSAIAPYNLKIRTTATDSDGVTGSVTDILSGSPLPDFRLGQARISNAHGSELQALRLPITVGHFNGTGYGQNLLDSCTVFNAAALGAYQRVTGASPAAPVLLSYLNSAGTPAAPFVLSAGSSLAGGYLLSAPGAGNDGNVRLTYATPSWLQFDWDGNGTLDPASALATFGIYRGATPLIFRRELYR